MLNKVYKESVIPYFISRGVNVMAVPKILKIVLSIGIGRCRDKHSLALDALTHISGQKAVLINAKKSVAGFKVREGMPSGCKVTLRNRNMWGFVDKLILFMPLYSGIKQLSPSQIHDGNLSFGVSETAFFPEIEYSNSIIFGMNINIVTSANNSKDAYDLLDMLKFPFSKVKS